MATWTAGLSSTRSKETQQAAACWRAHPAGAEVLGEQGQLGEGQGQEVVELIEQAGALADDGLQPAGHLAQQAQFAGPRRVRAGPQKVWCQHPRDPNGNPQRT